jgi:hypothetical protein
MFPFISYKFNKTQYSLKSVDDTSQAYAIPMNSICSFNSIQIIQEILSFIFLFFLCYFLNSSLFVPLKDNLSSTFVGAMKN